MPSHKRLSGKTRSLAASQPVPQQLTDTARLLNATNADFLKIDVQTALTFSGLALGTDNPEKRQRNRKNARKAYDTILRLWDAVTFTPEEELYMREMLRRLKNDLVKLGENP